MAAPRPGSVIDGKYRIEREIAAGGMGFVLLATHVQLDRPVAIKFLRPNALAHPAVVERFEREARIAARIRSTHTVKVHDVGMLEDAGPYMVMEYLDGSDLGHRIARGGPLDAADAVDIVLQACDALAEAHAREIIHRDIKPENLFMTGTPPVVKVIDFGISKVAPRRGDDGAWTVTTQDGLGTPLYMAPEQLQGLSADAAVDIWALGIVLHELLTGALPFHGDTMPQVCTSILTKEPTRLRATRPDLPPELEEVVLRCLAKDPRARFSSCVDLARALAPFGPPGSIEKVARMAATVHAEPTVEIAPPLPDPRRSAPTAVLQPRSNRGRAVFVGAAAAVAVVSLAFIIVRAGRTQAAGAPPANSPASETPPSEPPPPELVATPIVPAVASPQADDPASHPSATPSRRPRPRAAPTSTDSRAGFGERK
jgi:serine/threonine-protein kinase